jgi:hypothetical protein
MRKQFLVISAVVFMFGTFVFGQSIDINRPTPITSNVLEGTVKGSGWHYYSLRAKKGTVLIVRAISTSGSGSISIAFQGRDYGSGAPNCCSIGAYLSFAGDSRKVETSFTVLTNDSFLMAFNFDVPDSLAMSFKISFEGLESGDGNDDSKSADTITVDGRTGNNWVDTGIDIRKGDKVVLSPTGSVDVSAGWGIHDAKGTIEFADLDGYPVKSPRRYGLAAKIGSQKWAFNGGSVTATSTGRLYLTCNDDAPDDNEGEFVVKVRIVRNRKLPLITPRP